MTRTLLTTLLCTVGLALTAKTPYIAVSVMHYWNAETGPYVELHYITQTSSLSYAEVELGYQTNLEVTAMILDGEEVLNYDKFVFNSEVFADTTKNYFMFEFSRLGVREGSWQIRLELRDLNEPGSLRIVEDSLDIEAPSKTSLSGLMITELETLSDNYVRFGIPAFPRAVDHMTYYPTEDSILSFYTEVYQPETPERLIATYGIYNINTRELVDGYNGSSTVRAEGVYPVAARIPLHDLPTGTYFLKLEVFNREGEILTGDSLAFGRRNNNVELPMLDISNHVPALSFLNDYQGEETWKFLADCTFPIATNLERIQMASLIEEGDTVKLRRFVTSFWIERDPANTREKFQNYMDRVEEVNRMYGGGMLRGYQTDMGRVRLQYGDPNNVENRLFDNETYPYQIWQYNRLTSPNRASQTNKVFIFVNREIAGNEYNLIHSDAYGEVYDPQWIYRVSRGNNRGNNPDSRSSDFNSDPFGSRLNNNTIINSGSSNSINRR
ncbi:MAG: GWxTD domain-containing protein [Flavobacteriia bacterium]|nr:GWxTD domain-containing protein [Flavobacteriia bacterium]